MKVCGMMGLLWRKVQPCLLVLMTVVPTITSRSGCPADVKYETNQCLLGYNSHMNALGNLNFYTGVDVESIRSACTSLSRSITCVVKLKHSCPENSHSQIMTIVDGPLINMAELCHVEGIYELYSRHQFCYSQISTRSTNCSDVFNRRISPLKDRLSRDDQWAQKEYCRYFDQLSSCVQGHVEEKCGQEASTLTEKLVRASYGQSEPCQDEPSTTTTSTTTLGQFGRTSAEGEQHGAPVGAANTSRLSIFTAALALASVFIVNAAPLPR